MVPFRKGLFADGYLTSRPMQRTALTHTQCTNSSLGAMNCILLHLSHDIRPLMTRSPALSNDLGHLIHLSLRTAERPQSLLRELPCALVLAVAEKFDNTTLVRGETCVCTIS